MSNPPSIHIDIAIYLKDCPPGECQLSESLILELANEIARQFDCTEIYNQIDELAQHTLRERATAATPTN